MKVLGQYLLTEGDKAVTHALALVVAYLRATQNQKKIDELAKSYAPGARRKPSSRSARAIVVFDIDDTLIFDTDDRKTLLPHQVVLDLLFRLKQLGAEIHLVTARLDVPDMMEETRRELQSLGIVYDSLTLAPDRNRSSLAAVSKWKMQTRKRIAGGVPITLSVGDQWGDMLVLRDEENIDQLDARYKAYEKPYILVRPGDTVSLWGLKLPSYAN